jgi:hypothetical protein
VPGCSAGFKTKIVRNGKGYWIAVRKFCEARGIACSTTKRRS